LNACRRRPFIDSRHAGGKTGPNSTDRRKLGSQHHLIVDAQGILLAVIPSGAWDLRNGSKVTCPMFQRPPIR
jgi:hypothetical protein